MKIEPDTEKPITASAPTNSVEDDPTLKSTKGPCFLWGTCSDESQRDRINIKEQAVLDGLRLGQKVRSEVKTWIENENQRQGIEDLADWVEQFDDAKNQYETPHSKIGLIGVLGSGKSTLINAILGQKNLLPISNDRAGTAVACHIRYNYGSDDYRAKIEFRSHQNFTDEVDKLLRGLKMKGELMKKMEQERDATEIEAMEYELTDLDESTSGTLETLGILSGVTKDVMEEDLLGVASAKAFLEKNPLKLLGEVVDITETEFETFATKIKPFLASIPLHDDGKGQMVWPLVVDATIYVKLDFLKYGIEVLDLPGSGDAVESRSNVAERFIKDLDITAIIAPAVRATEEKGVIGFIKKRQENEMRMDGKFDRNSLCVVLSKGEDVDPHEYLKEKWIAEDYPGIKEHLDRAEMLDKIVRAADARVGKSESEPKDLGNSTCVSKDSEVEVHRQEVLALKESLKLAAVCIRNRSVSERIQKNFRLQQVVNKPSKREQLLNDTIEVFPTCARAFLGIRFPGCMKEAGFTHESYTGIPQLKQWLHEATFNKREEHLDETLTSLSTLFTRIQNWITANENQAGMLAHGSDVLESIHEQHLQSLSSKLRQSSNELRQIEPLEAKGVALAKCRAEYPRTINRWRYRYPNKASSYYKIHGNVQTCILRDNGDPYTSKGKFPHEYSWVDDLDTIFKTEILEGWQNTFRIIVPCFETKIQESLKHVWQDYSMALGDFCGEHNAQQLRSSEKAKQIIDDAKANLKRNTHRVLGKLQRGARVVHRLFRNQIQTILEPLFQQAYNIKGTGCVKARNELLMKFAEEHSADMPVEACKAMEAKLASLIEERAKELEQLAASAVSDVKKQMRSLLGISKAPVSPAARMNQQCLMKGIKPHLRSWELCWQKPSSQREEHVMSGDSCIPEPELLKHKDGEDGV